MTMGMFVKRACWAALWIGLLLGVLASPSAVAQSMLPTAAKTALQEGIAAAKFQNWDSAQKYFDEALAAAPGAPEVLFNFGLLNDRKGGAELVASAWYRAYLAALPEAPNRAQVEARLIELHASAEARAAKFMATAKEAARQLVPTIAPSIPPGLVSDCQSKFGELIRRELGGGRFESVDEILGWFQGNECQNELLHLVALHLFILKQPQEGVRYIERMSGPWKVSALRLFAAVKWAEGDQTTAIKSVEDAETLATQLLKGLGTSPDDKFNKLLLRSEMTRAWCIVGNVAKARRSFERIDPNLVAEIATIQIDSYFKSSSAFGQAFYAVTAALLSAGKANEARSLLRGVVSKIRDDWARDWVRSEFERVLGELTNMPPEMLNKGFQFELHWGALLLPDEYGWLSGRRSVALAQMTELQYWSQMASRKDDLGLARDVLYSDNSKFLATVSGLSAESVGETLAKASANLLLGSRKMKELAEDWRKKRAGSGQ